MSKVSDCCGADVEKADWKEGIFMPICSACQKPCGVKSEPVERVTYNASKDEVVFPAPSRLLTVSEIGEAYDKAEAHLSKADDATRKYGWDLEKRRLLLQAQDVKTSALVRVECQETQEEWQADFTEKMAAKYERRCAELKAELDSKQSYVSFEFLTSQLVQKDATCKKEMERVISVLQELVDLMEAVREHNYTPDCFTTQPATILLEALKKSVALTE